MVAVEEHVAVSKTQKRNGEAYLVDYHAVYFLGGPKNYSQGAEEHSDISTESVKAAENTPWEPASDYLDVQSLCFFKAAVGIEEGGVDGDFVTS